MGTGQDGFNFVDTSGAEAQSSSKAHEEETLQVE